MRECCRLDRDLRNQPNGQFVVAGLLVALYAVAVAFRALCRALASAIHDMFHYLEQRNTNMRELRELRIRTQTAGAYLAGHSKDPNQAAIVQAILGATIADASKKTDEAKAETRIEIEAGIPSEVTSLLSNASSWLRQLVPGKSDTEDHL